MSTCISCAALDCDPLVDSDDLYSLSRTIFPFIILCPTQDNCLNRIGNQIILFCCNREIVVVFPPNASTARKIELLQAGIDECAIANGFCGENDRRDTVPNPGGPPFAPPPTPPGPPPYLMLSDAKVIDLECPGGQTFRFILPAGYIGAMFPASFDRATARSQVNAFALARAHQLAPQEQFCVEIPKLCFCLGEELSISMRIVGGNGPFRVQLTGGYLAAGMVMGTSGRNVTLSGTPETPGQYTVEFRVYNEGGSYWSGAATFNVIAIGYGATLEDDFIIPAVASTVAIELDDDTYVEVGSILRIALTDGDGNTTIEYGTFEVTALDTPSPGETTVENLTGEPGVTVDIGADAFWELEELEVYSVNVPYTFQLPAVGGSGAYRWVITDGELPDGLEMSTAGVIAGTVTVSDTETFSVEVIDLNCLIDDDGEYEPIVDLIPASTTSVATVRGFGENTGFTSTPPKRYMVRTWSGFIAGNDASGYAALPNSGLSVALVNVDVLPPYPIAVSHFIISGADQINLQGQQIATHTAQLYSTCAGPNNVLPQAVYDGGFVDPEYNGTFTIPGWCYAYDISLSYPNLPSITFPKCLLPALPLVPDTTLTDPEDMYHGRLIAQSSTTESNTTEFTTPYTPGPNQPDGFTPPNLGAPTLDWGVLNFYYKHAYNVVLSVEYTDVMALANAKVTTGSSPVAQNLPRTTGFISRFTTVAFELKCSNLVAGTDYTVTVDYVTSAGVTTTETYTFIASSRNHTINDTVPTPSSGQTITVQNAEIEFTEP